MERFRWLALVLLVVLCGCENRYRYIPRDIEPVVVDIVRFDSALLSVEDVDAVGCLYADYERFMPMYMEGVLGLPCEDTLVFSKLLVDFLSDTTMGFSQTNALVASEFANIDALQQELNTGFSRLHYLYPDWVVPTVYLFVSGFNGDVLYYDDMIGVGVDMYLGKDYPYYNHVVYDYQKPRREREYISRDVLSMYVAYHMAFNSRYNRLLEHMIFRGKQLFLLSELLPDCADWLIVGYTREQWEWCESYERAIWNRIMEKRDLFKTESGVLTSYMNDGPFTLEVTQESPGRLGLWVGWRIVDSYMRNNEDVSIYDLINESDAQKILEKSYYKP